MTPCLPASPLAKAWCSLTPFEAPEERFRLARKAKPIQTEAPTGYYLESADDRCGTGK
jgi:hypothetical protein